MHIQEQDIFLPPAALEEALLPPIDAATQGPHLATLDPAQPQPTTFDIYQGDARDLSFLSSNSVDVIVTSPPYWA